MNNEQMRPPNHLEKGTLLIASPDVDEDLYFKSVVLICEHTPAGSFGLIVNKPVTVELPPEILPIDNLAHPKVQLRLGGKSQQNQMMLLHTSDRNADQTLQVTDNVYLGGDLQFLQESISSEGCPDLLLCFGYTGWTTGELEKEFMKELWFLHPASKELLFDTPSEKMWQTILKKMGGKYASLAMIPDDLTLN